MYEDSDNALKAHNKNGFRTLDSRRSNTITYRMLSFYTEQESWREAINSINTRLETAIEISRIRIAMSVRNQPPQNGEAQPRKHKAHGEYEEGPSPLSINKGGE